MNLVRQLDENLWRDFVDANPQSNIFHTPEMFEVFVQTKGYRPDLWAVVDENKCPLALFVPVTITLMGGLLRKLTSRAVVYGSVLCAQGPNGTQALAMLLQAYKRETDKNILFTELRNLSDLGALDSVLNENGFTYEEHLNYLVDLCQPIPELFNGISKSARKQIRRGLRNGDARLIEVTNQTELDPWLDLVQKTYRHARVPLADRSLFEAVLEQLYPKNMARFVLALINGAPAACSLELLYKDTVYGWYGGMDRQYGSYYANEIMHWHILKWSAEHGYCLYDFGGAGKPDEEYGVRDFKAKFGGKLVAFGRYSFVHRPTALRLSTLAYRLFRRGM